MNERRHPIVNIALPVVAAGACLAAGLWLFGGFGGAERRHESTGPVQDATAELPRVTATLEAAAAAREVERRAATTEASTNAIAAPASAGLGTVEGVFLAPRSLDHEAEVTLHALQWFDDDATIQRRETQLPLSEPWRLEALAAGNWRFAAEVMLDDRRWSSDWFDVELGEGAERRGVALTLVECYAEGVVTDRAGFAVPGAELEITSTGLFLDDGRPHGRALANDFREVRMRLESRLSSYQESLHGPQELRAELEQMLALAEAEGSGATIEISGSPTTVTIRHASQDVDRIPPKRWKTDATGYYRVPLRGPGGFGLRIVNAELIAEDARVEVDRSRPVATHDFEAARASSLSGRVAAAGGSLPEVVNLFLRLDKETQHAVMAADGTFHFERLMPGRYDFYARGGGDSGQDWSHHAKLDISEGFRASYDAILAPSYDVEGHVADPERQPQLYAIARSLDNPSLQRQALVRADGTFTIRGLYAGEYSLGVTRGRLREEHTFVVDEAHPPVVHRLELLPQAIAADE